MNGPMNGPMNEPAAARPRLAATVTTSKPFRSARVVAAAAKRATMRVPVAQLALRALLLLAGAAALLIAPGGRLVLPGVLVLAAVPALLSAAIRPDGPGPGVVLGAAAGAWTIRYGAATPPWDATLALTGALAVHHATAALCAAMPPTSRPEPAVLLRWAAQVATVLAVGGGVAGAVRLLGRPAASVPLEIAGVAAVVLVAAAPVLLARR
jgi:hypothetical protein